jgi:excisionase family DNA binding protein
MKNTPDTPTAASSAPAAMTETDSLLTTFQAARELGVAFSTINYWIDDGTLSGFRTPGGHRRIRRTDLEAFMAAHRYGQPGPRERRLLLVDDDDGFRRALKRRLVRARLPVSIIEADNGFDAGRRIVEEKPILVVLDIHLPGIDGFEVLRQVAAMPFHPKIVAISGHAPSEYQERALKLGAAAFFPKPLDTDGFLELIRSLLGVKAQRSTHNATKKAIVR